MFVLGIDPGVSRCGYGAIDGTRAGPRVVTAGVITHVHRTIRCPSGWRRSSAELRALLAEVQPDAVVVERVFFQTNVRTAMSVGQASGLALAAAAEAGCEVAQYTANEVKQAVAGYGAATKVQVQQMVQAQLGLPERARAARRRRRAGAGPVPPHRRAPRWPELASGADDRLAARRAARPAPVRRAARRGGRRRLPRHRPGRHHGASSTALGAPVFLHVHTHVREDAIVLYGFATGDERACFEALLGAHGVGPALALAILSSLSPVSLRRAVATDDVDALTIVPGVGKKTAARLLLELKSRLDLPEGEPDLVLAALNGNGATARAEVKAALAGLGYGADEVRDAVRELPDDGAVEDLLRSRR